jgi:hypothetical protein
MLAAPQFSPEKVGDRRVKSRVSAFVFFIVY